MSQAHRFHETHGNDIMIYHNWIRARRTETKDNGLVFTSNPVKPFERISVKLVEVSDKLPGIISIGFTNIDPTTLRYDLPKSTRSELKKRPGFWIGSLSKQLCVKDKVGASGSIHYGVDDKEKGIMQKGVDLKGKLWALIDIWSPTTTIQLGAEDPSSQALMFHHFRSRNLKIDDSGVHKFYKRKHMSYVFTSKPLNLNERILIKVVDGGTLSLGVTSCDPDRLKRRHLPRNPDSLLDRPEYWVVINDPTWNFQNNDELCYVITETGEMKIWKNHALLLKVVHVDHTLKLWGFFGLGTLKDIIVKISSTVDTPVVVPSAPDLTEIETVPTLMKIRANVQNPSAATPDHQSTAGTTSVTADQKQNQETSDCVICCENVAEAALYPCGHMCMCYACAKKQWRNGGDGNCPVCRAKIRDVLKVYKS